MARTAKVLRVTLASIGCLDASGDPGDNLEIFGDLYAQGKFLDAEGGPQTGFEKNLWHRDSDGAIDINPDTQIVVNESVEFPVFDRDFLWIGGKIVEKDDIGDDDILGDGF